VKFALEAMTKKADAAARERLRTALRERAARLEAGDGRPLEPSEAMVRAFFHALVVGVEADASRESPAASAEQGSAALRTLAALRPVPDIYESVQNMIVSARKEALQGVLGTLFGAREFAINADVLVEMALTEPERVRSFVERTFGAARERARAHGDPVLTWLVGETALEAVEGTFEKARAERLRRVEKVLEVALDSRKVLRLAALRDQLKAEQEQAAAAARTRRAADRRALLASLATPSDVRTLQAVLAGKAGGGSPGGEFAPGPEETRRLQHVTLAAYLRALSVPLPEALK
jgi:hypothetical protein